MTEPFINYGTEEAPLYLMSNVSAVSGIPARTIKRHGARNMEDVVIKKIIIPNGRKHKCHLINLPLLKKILCSVRYPIAQEILDFYQIEEYNKFSCAEAKFLSAIKKVFANESIHFQFPVNKYKLDAYFPKYNLMIEIDEENHRYYAPIDKIERCIAINFWLCRPRIIRFNPYEADVFDILRQIYSIIKN